MKITKKQLRRIVREALSGAGGVMTEARHGSVGIGFSGWQPNRHTNFAKAYGPDAYAYEKFNESDEDIGDIIASVIASDDAGGEVYGHGGSAKMAKSQLFKLAKSAQSIHDRLVDDDELPEWVQSKIAVMADNMNSVADHLDYKIHVQEDDASFAEPDSEMMAIEYDLD